MPPAAARAKRLVFQGIRTYSLRRISDVASVADQTECSTTFWVCSSLCSHIQARPPAREEICVYPCGLAGRKTFKSPITIPSLQIRLQIRSPGSRSYPCPVLLLSGLTLARSYPCPVLPLPGLPLVRYCPCPVLPLSGLTVVRFYPCPIFPLSGLTLVRSYLCLVLLLCGGSTPRVRVLIPSIFGITFGPQTRNLHGF